MPFITSLQQHMIRASLQFKQRLNISIPGLFRTEGNPYISYIIHPPRRRHEVVAELHPLVNRPTAF